MKKTNTPELNRIRELRDTTTGDIAPITDGHIYDYPQPYIEWLIDFLILTHIARRGKLLHIDTICQKLKRYGSDGNVAIKTFNTVISAGFNQEFNLELKKRKFNAKFMCIDTYNELFIEAYWLNSTSKKRLKHINSFAKKFHKSIIYADNVDYCPGVLDQRGKPKNYNKPTKRHAFKRNQQEHRLQQEIIQQKQKQQELPF